MEYPSPKQVVPVQTASNGSRDGGLKTVTIMKMQRTQTLALFMLMRSSMARW